MAHTAGTHAVTRSPWLPVDPAIAEPELDATSVNTLLHSPIKATNRIFLSRLVRTRSSYPMYIIGTTLSGVVFWMMC